MPPNNSPSTSGYVPWSTGVDLFGDGPTSQLQPAKIEPGAEFWSSESSDLETPAWDIEFSENGPDAWDYDLSTLLAAKLLMVDSNAGQLPQLDSDTTGATAYANPRFKTEFCRNFKEKGSCLYGDLCQFAHGRHELRRDVVRHNKYKTKLCQKFWIHGYCAYGPRCNFVHNEHDVYPAGHQVGSLVFTGETTSRFRDFQVSYRKTSLGDSGGDSGSEQGSVPPVAAAAAAAAALNGQQRSSPVLGPLSPPNVFHPEDNPLPRRSRAVFQGLGGVSSSSRQLMAPSGSNNGGGGSNISSSLFQRNWSVAFL